MTLMDDAEGDRRPEAVGIGRPMPAALCPRRSSLWPRLKVAAPARSTAKSGISARPACTGRSARAMSSGRPASDRAQPPPRRRTGQRGFGAIRSHGRSSRARGRDRVQSRARRRPCRTRPRAQRHPARLKSGRAGRRGSAAVEFESFRLRARGRRRARHRSGSRRRRAASAGRGQRSAVGGLFSGRGRPPVGARDDLPFGVVGRAFLAPADAEAVGLRRPVRSARFWSPHRKRRAARRRRVDRACRRGQPSWR